jgi:hypothetical protein
MRRCGKASGLVRCGRPGVRTCTAFSKGAYRARVAQFKFASVQYCTDICAGEFYNYHIELHTFRLCFFLCVSLKKMNLFDHRLAAILQIRTVLAARMFELRDLRRRVQTAQLNPRRRRRARSKTALFKSLDAESIDRPQRVGLAKWRVRCGRRLRPRLK